MSLPGSPHVAYRGQELFVEGCALKALARQFGTPLYVYSRTAMLESLAGYQRALAGRDHLICYAMKANSNLAVLQTFAQAGCGFDIVSGGELERVLAAGGDPSRVVFSGVGKTAAEMRQALSAGVSCFNVESESELALLSEVAHGMGRNARISLRVNPDVDAQTHAKISTGKKDNKFGIDIDVAPELYALAHSMPNILVQGVSVHIGSQLTSLAPFRAAYARVRTLVELRRVEKGMLAGLMILFFINTDNRTFNPGKDGLSFYLPAVAEVDQASISVGSGASNIQWLKLNAQKGARRGIYTIGQSVKPGERILQVMFHMPYNEAGTQVEFQSLYPQDTGLQLIAEPENLSVKQGDKTLDRKLDENLGRGLISFSPRDTAVVLSFSGGGIAEFKKAEEVAEIEVKSPLQLWQKLLFPVVAILFFISVAWLRGWRRNSAA